MQLIFEEQIALQNYLQELLAKQSLHTLLVYKDELFSHDLYHKYYFEHADISYKSFQTAIVDLETLLMKYPPSYDITCKADYPYLYIAYNEYTHDVIPLEVSNNEALIIQAIFSKTTTIPQTTLSELSPDESVQQTVKQIFEAMIHRMRQLSIPATRENTLLSLPLPAKNTRLYPEQIQWLMEKGIVHKEVVTPKYNRGEVAKRLRSLGMVNQVGSIQGVYTSSKSTHEWTTLNTLELALHNDRYIAGATLTLADSEHTILICWLDNVASSSGMVFIMSNGTNAIELTVSKQYKIGQSKAFTGDLQKEVENLDLLSLDEAGLRHYYDEWFANLRVPEFLAIFFEMMETQNLVLGQLSAFLASLYEETSE